MSQRTIGVVGAGTMGQGIAQVLVASGLPVQLYDVADEQLGRAQAAIDKGLGKLVAKEKLGEAEKGEAMARLELTTSLEALRGCEVIIEAAPEQPALKEKLFRDLSRLSHDAILASNTSSLSLTRLAAVCERPERVVGMHFFNPVPVLKLVEVIRAEQTSDATVARIEALARQLGKTPVAIADSPGFAVNRLLVPMINEAAFLLQEGAASAEDIDQSMKLGAAHPMGPLALADLIGLDVCLAIMEVLQEGFGDPKYRPCPLLRRMVAAGYLGRKTGRGFHIYE
ncbi:3-hydroxybutyryl-CoA dehydrogenase [Halomonas sp. MCCC 1A17488]|uniref:3-hydroxybutyryl-CoA dehydrogenase n=1 Tax=Billgrantia sulfidoxydans TaxID=2733484 RepID=A0ABX7W1K3_9GAMM|nr:MULTISPECIES: 3-hydroxybutyryl-CoA dehydrogenase [Halomonas]MCE8016020.1 3-hydroxybutyryl-CoA dehydrogenase [Halomonas sp. MCCC 1A17488]MCG3239353.1 3-hydroxybutyryl-CoA dehydrogenase [Halomonas sp. MCCC 1A17488]QPP50717.1 3-hydroxybutyryl-CoA dehydrogenase [Halomonas sp. SS10-MC5]QTP54294.1 3-hydroxybutyryl-CoA dehydrogenase [Halomonas sulfidoxydans]